MANTVLVVDDSPTIRKVVAGVLAANGFETVSAGDGHEALAVLQHTGVDLILLDFVMPAMNGYQFCRQLRSDSKFESLPVVLMSAKGDKIRGQFVQQTGAVDAITKPFDPRALLAVVESALRKPSRESIPQKNEDDTENDTENELKLDDLDLIADATKRQSEIRNLFARGLARQLLPVLEKQSQDGLKLSDRLAKTLHPENLKGLGGLLKLLDRDNEKTSVLAGDLNFISIAEVLQMLELQRQSGVLRVAYGDQEVSLFLNDGRIDLVRSAQLPLSFRLGRFLVEDGVLSRTELVPYYESADVEKRLLGEELIAQGKATEEQIRKALVRQSSELVYECVRWKSGRFNFDVEQSSPEATLAQLQLAPGGLLMEGFRRVDEWQLIEGSFKFDEVPTADATVVARARAGDPKLTPQEEVVLNAVDGKRTVREIVDTVDASTFDVCKILYQFLKSHLIRASAG